MLSVPSAASTVAPEGQAPHRAPEPPKHPNRRKLWFFVAVSALAGLASGRALHGSVSADVRSGSPGFRMSSGGHEQRWSGRGVTLYLDGSLKKLGPNADEAVMQAFGQWVASDPRLPALSFDTGGTSVQPQRDGKSTVSLGPITTPGHEKDVAITVTYSNDKTGEILEADTLVNSLYPLALLQAKAKRAEAVNSEREEESEDCQNRYDLQNVATHEAGHFFGLGEDMTERRATMFLSIGQCETHKRELSPTDVGAVVTLYAKNMDADESATGPKACTFGGPPAPGSAWPLPALLLGLAWLRRRT